VSKEFPIKKNTLTDKKLLLFSVVINVLTLIVLSPSLANSFKNIKQRYGKQNSSIPNRVIKCQLPLKGGLFQNLYYMAPDKQTAKKLLFNDKTGLFFDNMLFVKTTDYKGIDHVIPFSDVFCDSIGTEVKI